MFVKVLKYIGILLLTAAAAFYFYFAATLGKKGRNNELCREIKVVILDSAQNRFVNSDDVIDIINDFYGKIKGRRVDSINLSGLEELLNKRCMIRKSQAFLNIDGKMVINITQRKPIIRIESSNGGFYIDDTKYIFPLAENFTSYVPVVSGHIPVELYNGYRGNALPEIEGWIDGIYNLAVYLQDNPFWAAQIEQIYVADNGDLYLSPRVGDQQIVFGDLNNIEKKFDKLASFYNNVIPSVGWLKYNIVNLKYKGQIVCKKRNSKNKKASNTI